MNLSNTLLVLLVLLVLLYRFLSKNLNHWHKQHVPTMPNAVFGFGHMLQIVLFKESLTDFGRRLYNHTKASMIGFYFLMTPALLVRDPELVKSVLQTNFDSFRNNLITVSKAADPIGAKNPYVTVDPIEWKAARARVTNKLTGKKLRALFVIAKDVSDKLVDFTDHKINKSRQYECEIKEYFQRFTGEIVANGALAVDGQGFHDNPTSNSFAVIAKDLFSPSLFNGIMQALLIYAPSISKLFRIGFFTKPTVKFFTTILKKKVSDRKKMANPPNDYLQFSIDATKDGDLNEIVADIVTFYLDTYEASSMTLSFILFYLSRNQEVQDKLRAHIKTALVETSGEITYESLQKIPYLDQVISESQRLTPGGGVQMKVCTKEITLEGTDGLKCRLRPGDIVFIPVAALQRDPVYWTDPEKYDPERFNEKHKNDRHKFVFLPFGEGPRVCVGMRMGLMVIKLAVATVILKYSVRPSSKMRLPLELIKSLFLPHAKGGIWVRLESLK